MLNDMNPGEVAQEVAERIRPLRRVEFDQLVLAGCFEDERVELLFGAIVEMSPPDPSHDHSITVLAELLIRQLGGRARVRVQSSYAASEYSEPVPDIVIARPATTGPRIHRTRCWSSRCHARRCARTAR